MVNVRALILTAVVVCAFIGAQPLVHAADSVVLPDINTSTVPVDELRYPVEAWAPSFLERIEEGPHYLSRDEAIQVLPPPTNTSDITKAELVLLHEYEERDRTPENVARILHQDKNLVFSIEPAGVQISKAIIEGISEVTYFMLKAKQEYARARPTQLDPELTTVIPVPGHASYPSGHATQSRIKANILSYIDPDHKEQYEKYAQDIARGREVAGVHYPSDSEAGVRLADEVFARLLNNPDYKKLLDDAKAEFENKHL